MKLTRTLISQPAGARIRIANHPVSRQRLQWLEHRFGLPQLRQDALPPFALDRDWSLSQPLPRPLHHQAFGYLLYVVVSSLPFPGARHPRPRSRLLGKKRLQPAFQPLTSCPEKRTPKERTSPKLDSSGVRRTVASSGCGRHPPTVIASVAAGSDGLADNNDDQ